MFHCYTPSHPSSSTPSLCHHNPLHSSLVSLVKTRSNYSAVLTMGLPCARGRSIRSLLGLHRRKRQDKKKELFRYQSLDEATGLDAVRGAVEEGMYNMMRSVSIDGMFLESEEGRRVVRACLGGGVPFRELPGIYPPEPSTLQKELPDSTVPDIRPIHQSSCRSLSDVMDLSLPLTGNGKMSDRKENDDGGSGKMEEGDMVVTDDSCDLETSCQKERATEKKKRKIKRLLCCLRIE